MTAQAHRASPAAAADAPRVNRVMMALPDGLGVAYLPVEAERTYALRRFNRGPTGRTAYRRFFLAKPETCLVLSEDAHGSSLRRFRGPTARAFQGR